MSWARYLPPLEKHAPSEHESLGALSRGELLILAKIALAVMVVGVLLAGYAAVRYYRLLVFDDYRAGYAVGALWKGDGVQHDCRVAMETLYGGSNWTDRKSGWGEFVLGCEDGRAGVPSASWYQLRSRFFPAGD
jgi:hypothetical protein